MLNVCKRYCREVFNDGYWGDGVCLQAFSMIFKVNVYVCDARDEEKVMKLTNVGDNRPNIALLFDENHYDRIIQW